MRKILTDLHTHSIFSGHAYSTIEENLKAAQAKGLEAMGISEHYSPLFYPDPSFRNYGYLMNYKVFPKTLYDVRLLKGVEADISGLDGHLFGEDIQMPFPIRGGQPNMAQFLLNDKDYIIASVHDHAFHQGATISQTTDVYCKVLQKPKVLALGHIGRAQMPFDIDTVVLEARRCGKLIEINEDSFNYPDHIKNLCRQIAIRCAELDAPICVDSDAHFSWLVGGFDKSISMLDEIHFPEELIANRDLKTLTPWLEKTSAAKL